MSDRWDKDDLDLTADDIDAMLRAGEAVEVNRPEPPRLPPSAPQDLNLDSHSSADDAETGRNRS